METELTTAAVENAANSVDTDSGIGTMSDATSSPRSTPSESMENTPFASRQNSDSEADSTQITSQTQVLAENIEDLIGTLRDTPSSACTVNQSTQSTPLTSLLESGFQTRFPQNDAPNEPMETDFLPQTQRQENTPRRTHAGTQGWQRDQPRNRTAVPVMDQRGYYINTSASETRSSSSHISELQIFVRNFNGQVSTFQIRDTANVNDLKKLIHDKLGIPPSQQRLVYQGREFVDGKSLVKEYGVKNLSEISLLGRLRGGMHNH